MYITKWYSQHFKMVEISIIFDLLYPKYRNSSEYTSMWQQDLKIEERLWHIVLHGHEDILCSIDKV